MRTAYHRTWRGTLLACLLLVTLPVDAWATTSSGPAADQWPLDAQHFGADRVWRLSQGADVTVAVTDTGVDARHPDLAGRVLPGVDLTNRAANGQVDVSPDAHGTSVAAVIAGTGGPHGKGAFGLAPKAAILPIRVSDGSAVDPQLLAQALVYAVRHGADVINISMTTPVADPELRNATKYALDHHVIVVAAAGNNGDSGNPVEYPAAFPGVLAVAGTNRENAPWKSSERGSYVSLAAPAVTIRSARSGGGYLTADGTSYAAPYVAATAALLRAAYPRESVRQIVARMVGTARGSGPAGSRDDRLGHGVVNPWGALNAPVPHSATDPLTATAASGSGSAAWYGWLGGGAAIVLGAVGAVAGLRLRRRRNTSTRASGAPC
ncbi:S8 family serine peptidase [Streptomyces mirabilis]|uniref:S8 family serine peptidase n=1 Tax=Streptomyces mirabilis TaxID=68239 RepID=UPI0036DF348A